ncbi:MAG: succinate dehydrogenase assembly factor 2 [Woeseiaceae bacterium]
MSDLPSQCVTESRLRWHCRRGMRELDELLQGYYDCHYAASSEREKAAFRELLALPDPALIDYLLCGQQPDDRVSAHVLRQIRSRTRSPQNAP